MHVFSCFAEITSSKAALEKGTGAWFCFCRALALCRWIFTLFCVTVFFTLLFNKCIVRGFVPDSCLDTTIAPTCKNKDENITDTANYRPVVVATVVSKLLEHFTLSITVVLNLFYISYRSFQSRLPDLPPIYSMVLIYWKHESNKLLQLRMIYKNMHWLQFMVQQFTPLEDEIYPRGKFATG